MSKQNKKPLFHYIFGSYLILAVVLLLFFIGGFLVTDIAGELERNNYKYYYGKVDQKRLEIENVMVERWGNLRMIHQLKEKIITKFLSEDYCVDKVVGEALKDTIGDLDVSGGLIVLNDLNRPDRERDSLFIRNSNNRVGSIVQGSYTMLTGDLTLAKELDLALSDRWEPAFTERNDDQKQLIRYVKNRFLTQKDKFFWYKYRIGNQDSMMYFTPVFHDDSLIAILAFEVEESTIASYLSYVELSAAKHSAYALARKNSVYGTYRNEFINGPFVSSTLPKKALSYQRIDNVNFVTYSGGTYIAYSVEDFVAIVLPLRLGKIEQEWSLIAYIPNEEFYIHSSSIKDLIRKSALVTIVISVALAFLISKLMTSPMKSLVQFAEAHEINKEFGIREYDKILELMQKMKIDIADGTGRLDFVLRLLRTRMIILEHNLESGMVKKYGIGGDLLAQLYGERWPMSAQSFGDVINLLYDKVVSVVYDKDEISEYKILEIRQDFGVSYVKIVSQIENNTIYYFIIDYTNEAMIEKRLAYEEEYDRETGLLNRESFKHKLLSHLSENPDTKGAMVMWTLEDIDYVNNAYGYSVGDECIKTVGKVLSEMDQNEVFVSRYANNKYVTFIPFDQMRDKVIAVINEYTARITKQKVRIDDEKEIGIKICKGIAWFPADTKDIHQLCAYAEYAYASSNKRTVNSNHQFSVQSYESHMQAIVLKEHLDELISKKEVEYAFQPIVNLNERKIIGYEALMRPTSKKLLYVEEVLRLAAIHSKLTDIEILTMQEVFKKAKKKVDVIGNRLVFVNTIGDIQASKRIIGSIFGDEIDRNIVFDLPQVEKLASDRLMSKANWVHSNDFKLCFDDFGMWYSSGKLISEIQPEFIKLSKHLVRNIHMEPEKQETVLEIKKLCDSHGVQFIAVGIESVEELSCLKKLGIKYVQGFILGEPKFEIVDYLEDDVLDIIDSIG